MHTLFQAPIQTMSVPSLRTLAFTALARHYAELDYADGNERKLMEIILELDVELIPELMRRRMLVEAIDNGRDAAFHLVHDTAVHFAAVHHATCPHCEQDVPIEYDDSGVAELIESVDAEAKTKSQILGEKVVGPRVDFQY